MTYSIVARDPETGELGGAVQSHWFAAGNGVIWAEPAAGAVATQAYAEVSYGPLGLDLMRAGKSAEEALRALVSADEGEVHRQVAMVDARGGVAAHTGSRCIRAAGHRTGDGFSVQANMMLNDTVWDAMHDAFSATTGTLAERFLVALDAAEAEGGDIRGRQAAGIVVVRATSTGRRWEDRTVDVRVEDSGAPLPELRRLVGLQSAYDRLEAAEEHELARDLGAALAEQQAALALAPDNPEIAFWTAVSLAGAGRVDDARRTIEVAYEAHPGWVELLRRLAGDGLVEIAPDVLAKLVWEGESTWRT